MPKCVRCSRTLTNPHSIERHYGPVCAHHEGIKMSRDHDEKAKVLKSKRREHDPSTTTYKRKKAAFKRQANEKLPAAYKNKKRRNKTRLTDEDSGDLNDYHAP